MSSGVARAAWLCAALAGCGGATHRNSDAGVDAAVGVDANATDANATDASTTDASTTDASATDATSGAVSCDRRNLTCRVADPVCPTGQVPEIIDHCFGACVPIDQCRCTEPAACPHEENYTCHNFRQRCGPYLN